MNNKLYKISQNEKRKLAKKPANYFNAVLIGVLVVGVAAYIAITNRYNEKTYAIRDLDSKIKTLEQKNKELNNNLMQLQLRRNLEEQSSRMNLITAQNPSYLKMPAGWIAKK